VVYAIAVESIEREVASAQLAASLIVAMGGQAEAPTLVARQQEFDEWLASDFEPTDQATAEWRQVMGLGAA
jgi:hypothetical protein